MHLTELQFYINNIESFLGIIYLIPARRQDHQCYTLINCNNLFTSQLSKSYNYIHRYSVLLSYLEKYTIPKLYYSIFFHRRLCQTITLPPKLNPYLITCLIYQIKYFNPCVIYMIKDLSNNTTY